MFSKMSINKKILLVQLFSNGDCLYATTVARQIKNDFPSCTLTWAIAPFCKSIIANNPYVDDIWEVDSVAKNDIIAYRRFKNQLKTIKSEKKYDEIFIIHNMDDNQALYDGCIRSGILAAYPNPITVPVTPVLILTEEEKGKAKQFATANSLDSYKTVVLFEYAPMSGQSKMSKEFALDIAESIVQMEGVCIIMSSGNKIEHPNKAIIDGSQLNLRETAALTHYCHLLLGSSSGITWLSTSDGAKQLPMIQLLNAYTYWVNPVSRDFERFGFSTEKLIELIDFDKKKIVECVQLAINDFHQAKKIFSQPIPLHFKTTERIVYNLLCYLQLNPIKKHIEVNQKMYGFNLNFYIAIVKTFLIFPFKLFYNLVSKRVVKAK